MTAERGEWWAGGLRFECHRCGACCRGAGNVWVSDDEIAALAAALGATEADVRARYTRRAAPRGRERTREAGEPARDAVLRSKRNQDCVFWEPDRGCTVYAHRPRQCRTYPFWRAILRSPESWEDEARACRGVGSGPVRDAAAIALLCDDDGIPSRRTLLRTLASERGGGGEREADGSAKAAETEAPEDRWTRT